MNKNIKIGDFVAPYLAGYWQLIALVPKIATEDDDREKKRWRKGDCIGQWSILKKVFTSSMKPCKTEFNYEDAYWTCSVPETVTEQILRYFEEHPKYFEKYQNAEPKFPYEIANCWFDLPQEREEEFRALLATLPEGFTREQFWEVAAEYKQYATRPPTSYLLNFLSYPWLVDKNGDKHYIKCEMIACDKGKGTL